MLFRVRLDRENYAPNSDYYFRSLSCHKLKIDSSSQILSDWRRFIAVGFCRAWNPKKRGESMKSKPCKNRSEEHTSELQSLMRISYAVFCLNKKKHIQNQTTNDNNI